MVVLNNIGKIYIKSYYWRRPSSFKLVQLLSVHNIVLLRDVFHIGLVIGPRPAVLALGAAEAQYSRPRTYN